MKVAIAGGTGFIGKVIIKKLVESGHRVVALIRQGSLLKIASISGMESRYIYYDSPTHTNKIIEDCQALINIAGIIKETKENSFDYVHHLIPKSLVKAAKDTGLKRFIQMSALGVGGDLDTEYMQTKRLGENVVKSSGLDWTIFRPSVVYGPADHFVNLLAKMMKLMPFFPVVGDGRYKFQPVSVFDVADGFIRAVDNSITIGKTYDVAGPDVFMFDQILDIIGQSLGKKKVRKLHQPLWIVMLNARLWSKYFSFPLTPDMIRMMLAGSVSNDDSFFKDLNIEPMRFEQGIKEYL